MKDGVNKICYKCNEERTPSDFKPKRIMCHECVKAQKREHYALNKEAICEDRKSLNGYYVRYKTQSKSRGYCFKLTREQTYVLFQGTCRFCGQVGQTGALNGIDRVNNSEGYTTDNVESCCNWCNKMKGKYSDEQFIDHIQQILNKNWSNNV